MITKRLFLSLLIALSITADAQEVHMPDPNLCAAIRETLNLPADAILTVEHMLSLTRIGYKLRGIKDLTGLEHATNLERLGLVVNEITDIHPLAGLVRLEHLHLRNNKIADISPLANLTRLSILRLQNNRIVDVAPLAKLRRLDHLDLHGNLIVDVSPLANLQHLTHLNVASNPAHDYGTLNTLSLTTFLFDECCESPPSPVSGRIYNRRFPAIFAAWGGPGWIKTLNRPELSDVENLASHHLFWSTPRFRLWYKRTAQGYKMVGNIDDAVQRRNEYLSYNPNMLFLVDIPILTFPKGWFPENWPHWLGPLPSPDDRRRTVDFTHPEVQDFLVERALAVERCGLYDGIYMDHGSEGIHYLKPWGPTHDEELIARDNIWRRIRAHARKDFLIIIQSKRHKIPLQSPYINGTHLETAIPWRYDPDRAEQLLFQTEETLLWAAHNLRQPRINAVEGFSIVTQPADSPRNLQWMRAFTTLSLTHSDGYVLFNHGLTHSHLWYDFWDADLGQPVGEKGQLYQGTDGLYIREYTNGWAVYNHSGAPQVIRLPEEVQGVASGLVNVEHALPDLDGEMYLRVTPQNPADVNGDGVVNILDLTLVAQGFGTNEAGADVNGDGVVNVFDLVMVAAEF